MAQFGSVVGIAVKAFTVSGKKNECSIASARSNCFCASGVHDVLKSTRPKVSPDALVSSCADVTLLSATDAARARMSVMILCLMSLPPSRLVVEAALLIGENLARL